MKYKYDVITNLRMDLSIYKEIVEIIKITLNYVVKENPIKGQFRIKIDKNDLICNLQEVTKENQKGILSIVILASSYGQ